MPLACGLHVETRVQSAIATEVTLRTLPLITLCCDFICVLCFVWKVDSWLTWFGLVSALCRVMKFFRRSIRRAQPCITCTGRSHQLFIAILRSHFCACLTHFLTRCLYVCVPVCEIDSSVHLTTECCHTAFPCIEQICFSCWVITVTPASLALPLCNLAISWHWWLGGWLKTVYLWWFLS